MCGTIIATNAMSYVVAPNPALRTSASRMHLAAFKNAGGCTAEATSHCADQPDVDVCIAAYRRAHHC
jgi:hypothetical protein